MSEKEDVLEVDSITGGEDQNLEISADLIRGHINTIILRSLYDGDKYGYEMVSELARRSDNTFELKDTFEEPDAVNVNNQLGSLYNHYNNKEWINIEFTPYK